MGYTQDTLIWPERITLRDTKVFADEGQRIFTTATGYGYEKQEYVIATALADREAKIAELERERARFVEAIRIKGGSEHAPTEDAYSAACRAIEKHRERADRLEAQVAELRQMTHDWEFQWTQERDLKVKAYESWGLAEGKAARFETQVAELLRERSELTQKLERATEVLKVIKSTSEANAYGSAHVTCYGCAENLEVSERALNSNSPDGKGASQNG